MLNELAQTLLVALTTDVWTSKANTNFITVTAHFIDVELQMVARVLNTFEAPQSNTAENLANTLTNITDEWQISCKISCIVTDGCRKT